MQKKKGNGGLGVVMGTAVAMVALSFLVPVLCFGGSVTAAAEERGDTAVLQPVPTAVQAAEPVSTGKSGELDGARTVRVLGTDGTVDEMSMRDYLWGVVAAEMPAAFEPEALKAQSVAARTYTLWKSVHNGKHAEADVCTDYTCCQAWIGREEAAANWGENGGEYSQKITDAVAATDGMVLCWEGEPIQAVFHSSSAGSTEDAVAVWGTTVPYLLGVETPEGDEVPNYHSAVILTADEVAAALSGYGCDLSGDASAWFQGFLYTENGAVATAQVGGVMLSGPTLRTALGLRSATFEVTYEAGSFTFFATGYGHGVGMSQYGANALAKQGKTWEEIVAWYYTGVTVEQYPA